MSYITGPKSTRSSGLKRLRNLAMIAGLSFAQATLSGCFEKTAAILEDFGITVVPYIDIDESLVDSPLITIDNAGQFLLSGGCSDASGAVEIVDPVIAGASTTCVNDTWSMRLDLTALSDGKYTFKIRHSRRDRSKYIEITTGKFVKITATPTAPASTDSNGAVNNSSVSGGVIHISWAGGTDSAGDPLVGYQYSVGIGTPSNLTSDGWINVGASTSASVNIPSQVQEGSDIYINIQGIDQTGQVTATATSDPIRVDNTPPSITNTLSGLNSASSLSSSPPFTWDASSWSTDITSLQYRIVSGGTSVMRDWTSITNLNPPITASGLNLTAGNTYTFEVRALDAAGNISTTTISQVWMVVSAPPQLVFTTAPSSTSVLGTAFSQQPVVTAQDSLANTLSNVSGGVTLMVFSDSNCTQISPLTPNNPTATLSGGVATFSGFSVSGGAPESYYIKPLLNGTTASCSGPFTATGKMAFTAVPSGSTVGGTFPSSVTLQLRDGTGGVLSAANPTVNLSAYPGSDTSCSGSPASGNLSGASSTASSGLSTFSGLAFDTLGTIRLKASASGYEATCSSPISLTGVLAFTNIPTSASATVPFASNVTVELRDASGTPISSATPGVQLSVYAGSDSNCSGSPFSGSLTGGTVNASAGTATFSGVQFDTAGSIRFKATATDFTATCSGPITIGAAPAPTLVFTSQPSASAVAGATLASQPIVQIQNYLGNPVTNANGSISLTAHTDSACTSSVVGGLTNPTASLSSGNATFSGVGLTAPAGTYYLKAALSGANSACSSAFNLTGNLAFASLPSYGTVSTALSAFTVNLTSSGGSTLAGASGTVQLVAYPASDTTCSGSPASGVLSGTSVAASNGTASFSSLTYGTFEPIRLKASASGYASACSSPISLKGVLAFTSTPASASATVPFATAVTLSLKDGAGNTLSSVSPTVQLFVYSGTDSSCSGSNASGTLTGGSTTASAGTASFSGLQFDTAASIRLKAVAVDFIPACSDPITVGSAPAPTLVFTSQPSASADAGNAFAAQPVVQIQNYQGNPVTSATGSVSLTAHTDSACTSSVVGSLSSPTASLSSGNATFSGVGLTAPAGTYYLKAALSGANSACSSATSLTGFLSFASLPAAGTVSVSLPAFSVNLTASGGGTLSGAAASVQLTAYPSADTTCSGTTSSGTLSGSTVVASNGSASFSAVTYGTVESIRLKASASGYSSICSSAISINAATNPVPSIATNPFFWFKADAISGVAEGGNVTTWNDSSGNGRNAGQRTGLSYPTYTASAPNIAKPAVKFTGSHALAVPAASLTKPTSYTTFIVVALTSPTTQQAIISTCPANGDGGFMWSDLSNYVYNSSLYNGYAISGFGSGAGVYSSTRTNAAVFSTSNQFKIITLKYASGSTTSEIYSNGTLQATTAVSSAATSPGSTIQPFVMGAMGYYASGYYMTGYISELITYPEALTPTNRAAVENYLGSKYAIPTPMTLTSSKTSVLNSQTAQITASGGNPPYTYSVTGSGSINSNGVYTAPFSDAGNDIITVTDSLSQTKSLIQNYAGNANQSALAGAKLWLRASDIAGANNSAVAQWNDRSGYGNHAAQATAAKRPTYLTSGFSSGIPGVQFNNTILTIQNASTLQAQSLSVFMVVKPIGTGTKNSMLLAKNGTTTAGNIAYGMMIYRTTQAGKWMLGTNTANNNWADNSTSSTLTDSSTYLLSATYDQTMTRFYKNGSADGTDAHTGALTSTTGTLQIGGYESSFSNTEYANAVISEVVLFDSALSTTQRQNVESYLGVKYGIVTPFTLTAASSTSVLAGATLQLTANGGTPPYTYSVTGGGSVNASGLYSAPASGAGAVTATATDASGNTSTLSLTYYDQNSLGIRRLPITITNSSTTSVTNYPVSVTVNTSSLISAGKLNTDCSDLRVVDSDGTTQLSFWLESGCNTTSTSIWVKVPTIGANTATTKFYITYGISANPSQSNGNNVFPIFDEFNGTSLDSTKWNTTGTVTVSSGSAVVQAATLTSKTAIPSGTSSISVESRVTTVTLNSSVSACLIQGFVGASSNYWSWYNPGSYNTYFCMNGTCSWQAAKAGAVVGTFRMSTIVRSNGLEAITSNYSGTSGNMSGQVAGTPDATARTPYWTAPYAAPKFTIDWTFARQALTPEATTAVGAEE